MHSAIVKKILQRIGQPDLFRILTEDLTGTELNTILLDVFSDTSSKLSPPQLLNRYQSNRFVKPADLPVLELKRMELDVLELFNSLSFEPIELSPVSVLGSCSVVATADQNKVLSALRGTEVLADATNSIALHICDLKQNESLSSGTDMISFSTVQRHIRTQQITGKGFTPHFKIACLVTAGIDRGSFSFEKEALLQHIIAMKQLYINYYKVDDISFRFLCRKNGYDSSERLAEQVKEFVIGKHPELSIEIIKSPEKEIDYYKGIQYKVDIHVKGKTYEIGDGGFVDWTQQLLQNKKERMLSTGIGFDFMYRIMRGDV
ncbi:MAG TPA: hypothetical protein VK589_25125 [Chryseolinea sp.]|nr:hypothetical protein [Chryseolinea sp.]